MTPRRYCPRGAPLECVSLVMNLCGGARSASTAQSSGSVIASSHAWLEGRPPLELPQQRRTEAYLAGSGNNGEGIGTPSALSG